MILGAYHDLGKVLTEASVSDGPDPVGDNYSAGSEIRCRARQLTSQEVADHGDVQVTDWEIRVPSGTTVDHADAFRITKYRGSTVSIDVHVVGRPHTTQGQIVLHGKTASPLTVA